MCITRCMKCSEEVRKEHTKEQRNPCRSSQDAVGVFQQQTGGVCCEGNLLFTPELSSLRPRRHAQLEDCSSVLPHPDCYSMAFSIFSCRPSSLFTVLQVTGGVDEHITHPLFKKKLNTMLCFDGQQLGQNSGSMTVLLLSSISGMLIQPLSFIFQ